jgi:hypothetical protein
MMGCCKDNAVKRRTKENISKIAEAHERIIGHKTRIFMKVIEGVEVYDYEEIYDENENIIYTDKQDGKDQD